jgi:hypothetical protein
MPRSAPVLDDLLGQTARDGGAAVAVDVEAVGLDADADDVGARVPTAPVGATL